MPVLPYCIALTTTSTSNLRAKGVRDSGIHQLQFAELTVIYSEMEKTEISPQTFQQAALDFHNVVHAMFQHCAVVPFRFPTWLTKTELAAHMQMESECYKAFLRRNADRVQMELRISLPSAHPAQQPARSGTEHLRARAAQLRQARESAEKLKQLLADEVFEWRERETQAGVRLYALVDRNKVEKFRERLSEREREMALRWNGPWPATEFLEQSSAESST